MSKKTGTTHGRGYVYQIQYHIVWCTKYRRKVLIGEVETLLKEDLYAIANKMGFKIVALEVMPDHLHMLVDCTPQHAVPTLVKVIKGTTARHLFMAKPELKEQLWGGHLWNPSYFVATISDNTSAQVEEYINSQKEK